MREDIKISKFPSSYQEYFITVLYLFHFIYFVLNRMADCLFSGKGWFMRLAKEPTYCVYVDLIIKIKANLILWPKTYLKN